MSDLGSLLREHYEEIAPPIDVDRLADFLLTEERLHPTPPRAKGALIAVAAALIVLLVIGGTTLFIQLIERDEVIEEPPVTTTVPSTTVPSTTVPEEPPPDAVPGPDEGPLPAVGAVGLPFTVLDREGDVGAGASIIVTSDGIPMVAYAFHPIEEGAASEIRLATCADAECSAPGTVATIAEIHEPPDPPGEGAPVGVEIQALLPNDGLPIVIWSEWDDAEDGGESYLRAYKCSDPMCSDGTLTTIADGETSGLWVAVGSDNLPVVAQRTGDWETISIEITKCGDPACAGPLETSTVGMSEAGWSLVVTLDGENLPVFATQLTADDGASSSLGIARCTDPVCAETPPIVDTGIPVGELSAIALDANDRPVVLASGPNAEGHNDNLMLIACTDPTCGDDPVITVIAEPQTAGGDVNPIGSLAVGEDGTVTTLNSYHGEIHVVTCADPTCADGVLDVPVLPDLGWTHYDLAMTQVGNPVVAIHTNTDLGVFVCADSTCATSQVPPLSDAPGPDWAATIAAVADVQFSGTNPSIEIGPDGYPVIAYLGFGTDQGPEGEHVAGPKLLVCGDTGCTTSTTQVINDESAWVSMVIRPNGLPVVVYSDWTDDWSTDQLFVAWCADPGCTTWTTEKVDETDWFSSAVGIASQSDGSVAVVAQNGNYYVNLVSCGDGTCAGAEPVRIESLVDPNDNEWGLRWWMNSLDLAVLPDGRPVIAAAQSNGELRYVECLDAACTDSQRTTIDQTLDDMTAAIAVGPSGLPILAHYDDGELTVTACHDSGCQDTTVTAIGEATAGSTGSVRPSIAFGADGNPMIAYWAPRALMLAECHDPMCTNSTIDMFASVRTHDLAILPNGSPVMTYFAYSDEEPPPGEEEFGQLIDLRVAVCTSGTCVGG
jgi:hypothetical protein